MRYKMTKKYQICHHQIRFFQAQNAPKSVFDRGSAPDPAGGAYDAALDPLVGWGGKYPLIPSPLDAFGVSNSAPTAPRFSGPLNTKSWLRQCLAGMLRHVKKYASVQQRKSYCRKPISLVQCRLFAHVAASLIYRLVKRSVLIFVE